MSKVTVRKRWCFSTKQHRVGSVYAPKAKISIYNEFSNSWTGKIIDSDRYYSNRGWNGTKHPRYPRWGHVSWFKVKMCHNAVWKFGCVDSDTFKIGIKGYWDGSKTLV